MEITKTYFMVPVADMDRAVALYRDTLGLTSRFASPEWSELSLGDAVVALHRGVTVADGPGWLGFEVADLDRALAEIEDAGGVVGAERVEGGVRLVSVTDPEGNTLAIGQQSSWNGSQ